MFLFFPTKFSQRQASTRLTAAMGGVASVTGDVKGKGNELFKAGKYGEAVDAYTLALDADPKDHTVYSNRSAARMKCVGGAGRWGGVVCGVVWGRTCLRTYARSGAGVELHTPRDVCACACGRVVPC